MPETVSAAPNDVQRYCLRPTAFPVCRRSLMVFPSGASKVGDSADLEIETRRVGSFMWSPAGVCKRRLDQVSLQILDRRLPSALAPPAADPKPQTNPRDSTSPIPFSPPHTNFRHPRTEIQAGTTKQEDILAITVTMASTPAQAVQVFGKKKNATGTHSHALEKLQPSRN